LDLYLKRLFVNAFKANTFAPLKIISNKDSFLTGLSIFKIHKIV